MPSGVKYTRTRGGPIGGQSYRQMASRLQGIVKEEMTQAAIESEAEGKAFIGIAGTQNAWNGKFPRRGGGNPSHAGRGRIDSGDMQRAFTYRVQTGGENAQIEVGWVGGGYQPYMGAQDQGTSAGGFRERSDFHRPIEGMGLLAHIRFYARARVELAMDRATKRVTDGL